MYEFYSGTRTGLSGGDVSQIRSLYARGPASVGSGHGEQHGFDRDAAGRPRPPADVWRRHLRVGRRLVLVHRPGTQATTITLKTSGLSLLAGRLAVFNASVVRLGMATATGPGQDLTLTLHLKPGAKYFVRVDDAGKAAFAAGQYTLSVVGTPGSPTVTLGGQAPVDDSYSNETFLTATRLGNQAAASGGTAYEVFGSKTNRNQYRAVT